MSDDKKKTFQENAQRIDVGLNDISTALGDAVKALLGALKDGQENTVHEQVIETSKGPIKAYAGVKMRAAGLDISQPATAATDKPDEATAANPANTMMTETSAAWIITADIPGVSHQDLHLSRDKTALSIATQGPRHYSAHIDIGAAFDLDDIAITLARGVLTLEIPKGGSA